MENENNSYGLLGMDEVNKKDQNNYFTLKNLPYEENALEPYISANTLRFHFGKHLATYVANTNKQKQGTEFEDQNLADIILNAKGGLFNNAAQVFNHYFYFESMHAPIQQKPLEKTEKLIIKNFGSLENFKEKFTQAGASLFGSGWVWLVQDGDKLEIMSLPNAENPLKYQKHPLLTMDVWEHAYYLDTQNARPKYIENFWQVINWEVIERRIL